MESAFQRFVAMEAPLQQRLVSYLASKPGVTLVGPSHGKPGLRVPTVSFVAEGKRSADVAAALHRHNVGCR